MSGTMRRLFASDAHSLLVSPLRDFEECESRLTPGFFSKLTHIFHSVEHAAVSAVHTVEHAAVSVAHTVEHAAVNVVHTVDHAAVQVGKEVAHVATTVAKNALPLVEDAAATALTGDPLSGHLLASAVREYASGQHDIKKIVEHQVHAYTNDVAKSLLTSVASVAVAEVVKVVPSIGSVTAPLHNVGGIFDSIPIQETIGKTADAIDSLPQHGNVNPGGTHVSHTTPQLTPAAFHTTSGQLPGTGFSSPGLSGKHGTDRYVVYQNEIRVNGSAAWRNNNPGNLRYYSTFAPQHGAIGKDPSGFAIFPDEATGRAAMKSLLETKPYQSLSLGDMIRLKYAQPHENDTAAYIRDVVGRTGIAATTPMSSLTGHQLDSVINAMINHEHTQPGTVYHPGDPNLPQWITQVGHELSI